MQVQRHQMDYVLFFTVVLLTGAGIITVYSASTIIALQNNPPLPADYYAKKQLLWAILGLAAMVGMSWLPHRFWYRITLPLQSINLFLLLLVLVPHIGWSQYGGRRWIGHGSLHLQPSELAILATVVYLAFFFTKKVTLVDNFRRGVGPGLVVVTINFGLIFMEPDMGTSLTLLATCLVLIFASGARVKPLIILMSVLAPIMVLLASVASYRSARLAAWLHPFKHAGDISYQLIQGMTAISAGGLFGRGFDKSLEKAGYLPFPQTDFIFPVFVEEWGLIGSAALLFTLGVLVWRGFYTARHSPDRFGSLLSVGLTSQIIISSFINLGAVTGLLPVTGIPLPFISYGGTDLFINLVSMGILLSISRVTLREEPEADQLADVVSVEAVMERRELRTKQSRPPLIGARQAPEKGFAEVHRLRTKPSQRREVNSGAWRSRQQVSSTDRSARGSTSRGSAGRGTTSTRSTGQAGPLWRERQSGNWSSRDGSPKPNKPKR